MKIHQLSLFLENKPGPLRATCKVLADAGINIVTLSLADTKEFGILRLLVRDWRRAKQVLEETGRVVSVTEVVAVDVADRPGGMDEILSVIEAQKIGIEYLYAFAWKRESKAVLIFRFEDTDKALTALQKAGLNLVSPVELFDRVEA